MAEVLLGVGGGIAAFKSAALASRLVQDGHGVRVAMTRSAQEFIGPLTFEGLTGRKAILSAAHDAGIGETSPSYALLQNWLQNAPGEELEATWRGYVEALIETLSAHERRNFCESALKRARSVAAVAGGVLGLGNKISASEKRVLDELATAFETS